LAPGLIILFAAAFTYKQLIHNYPIYGLDLHVYTGGVGEFVHGHSAYAMGYTGLALPYTYPPISLLVFTPLWWIGADAALIVMMYLSVAATFGTVLLALRSLRYTGTAGLIGVSALVTGLMMWFEPFQLTFSLGQVNVLLMLLVVADCALPDRARGKGVMIGVAAAIKLIPLIFVAYLLLTRRFRAAAVAVGTFLALTVVGWVAMPAAATDYWGHGLFIRPGRVATVVGPKYVSNQSLHGMAVRVLDDTPAATVVWLVAGLIVGATGLSLAVLAHRRGEELAGVVLTAVTGLLLSPIAWSHHWVWIAPLLVVLFDVALRLKGRIGTTVAGAPIAVVVFVFACWPIRADRHSRILPQSFIWRAPHFYPVKSQHYATLTKFVEGELFTLTALGLLVLAALWLYATAPVAAVALPRQRTASPEVPPVLKPDMASAT
jgi:alpha-1,2-mannosyltransferase